MLAAAISVLGSFLGSQDSVAFEKTRIDSRFVSEGVAVADVDRDGRPDIMAGSFWYRAPDWKPQSIVPYRPVDAKQAWSDSFHNWAADLNRDGWIDQLVIGMPGEKAVWRENPKGKEGPWKEHLICPSAGNESPLYADLFGDGKRVLVMGTNDDYLGWFEPGADPYAPWVGHPISGSKGAGSQRYSHGLGVADLDGDGKNEVLTTMGYYTAPPDPRSGAWRFMAADFGPDCAHMLGLGPGKGFLTSSSHARGVWWFRPLADGGFGRETVDMTIGQTHAAILVPLGKEKRPNFITGKRKWAHPPGVDVGSDEPAWLVRYELGSDGKWTRLLIDEDSGIGTQIVGEDVDGDGRLDIVVANKNGVFLFRQKAW